jgi:hypothetical protein
MITIDELKAAREEMKYFGWFASCDGGDAETYQQFGDIAIALIDAEIERQRDWRKFPEDEEWLDINKIECLAEEIWGYIDDDEFQRLARYDFYPLVIAVNQMVDVARKIRGAEIERQSVTDAEIDEAENFVKAVASRRVEIDEELMKIFGESNRHWNLIVDALRAYRKPESPDKAIRRIIDERYKGLTKEERLANFERLKNCDRKLEVSPEVWRAAAEDLGLIEPIEPEPCDWCKETSGFMPLDFVHSSIATIDGEDRPVIFWHCPNCGRELEVPDD